MEASQQNYDEMENVLKYYNEITDSLGAQFKQFSESDVYDNYKLYLKYVKNKFVAWEIILKFAIFT